MPGSTVKFPIYLSSVSTLKDMTFQLEFPEVLTPDFENVEMSDKAVGYTISYTKQDACNYIFTITGGYVPAGNMQLLTFNISVPDDIATAQDYPVKINLVNVVEEDGNTITASTRNGRISVYNMNDVNHDGSIDVLDVVDIVRFVIGDPSDAFVEELADLNCDGVVTLGDAVILVSLIAGEQNFANAMFTPRKDTGIENAMLEKIDNHLSLILNNEREYTAFQFDLYVPDGVDVTQMLLNEERSQNHQLLYNKVEAGHYRVAAISLSNNIFKGEDGLLLDIVLNTVTNEEAYIQNLHFFNSEGDDYLFTVHNTSDVTGIDEVVPSTSKSRGFPVIYDLQGRQRATLQRGINIVGGKIVLVK